MHQITLMNITPIINITRDPMHLCINEIKNNISWLWSTQSHMTENSAVTHKVCHSKTETRQKSIKRSYQHLSKVKWWENDLGTTNYEKGNKKQFVRTSTLYNMTGFNLVISGEYAFLHSTNADVNLHSKCYIHKRKFSNMNSLLKWMSCGNWKRC